jgi:hypothetical protein
VFDTRASAFLPVSALMSEDLPTLERPTKAISGSVIGGRLSADDAPQKKSQEPRRICARFRDRRAVRFRSLSWAECLHGSVRVGQFAREAAHQRAALADELHDLLTPGDADAAVTAVFQPVRVAKGGAALGQVGRG